jgi:hypothetical protein
MSRWLAWLLVAVALVVTAPAAADEPLRPYEAPLFEKVPELPPLPAEYLKHDQGGIRYAYHPSARERVRALIEESDAIRSALSALLGEAVLGSIDVRVTVGHADFDRVVPPGTPGGAGAVALSQLSLLVMALRAEPMSMSEVRAAFRRGLAHLALDQVAGVRNLPRWLRVGFAIHFAEVGELERGRTLWWASLERRLLPLEALDLELDDRAADQSVAAAEAADFVAFLLDEERGRAFAELAQGARVQGFEQAMRTAFQDEPAALEAAWRADVAKHKAFVPIIAAGTGIWLLLAAGVKLRQRWRARKVTATAPPPEPKKRKGKSERKRRRKALAQGAMIEPEVPKVAHNGRWHTLH